MGEARKTAIQEKFAEGEYPIHVIGRKVEVTDAMKKYAIDKLQKIQRFGGRVIEATVVMDIQKLVHSVDFIINVNNTKVKVSGRTENMYSAIDQAIDHLEAKLRRYHKRLTEHHAKGVKSVDMKVSIIERAINLVEDINDQIEEETLRKKEEDLHIPRVINKKTKVLKYLNQEEAIMKIELSGDLFLIYKGEEDHKLKVIYRRDDGNYGVIELE